MENLFFSFIITVHGSQASLISAGSSLYNDNEIRRLKRELADARDQVMNLSSQLSNNVSTNLSLIFITIIFLKLILKYPTMMFSKEFV
jgi:hypothetical protein